MSAALQEEPQVIHATPGRLRVHLPGWTGNGRVELEARLRALDGVTGARANPLTANVVIAFNRAAIHAGQILDALRSLVPEVGARAVPEPPPPHVVHERRRQGSPARARISVRGLERDPHVAVAVLERLGRRPGVVRVAASVLTGRVLVEYEHERTTLDDLIAEIARVELPELPGEDQPTHPLDPAPLVQSALRTAGAGVGLAFLAVQHAGGYRHSPRTREIAGNAAATAGILLGFPLVRNGLRSLLGRNVADVVMFAPTAVMLALAGSPLGLATLGTESLRLLTEVLARRAAWRRYEEQLGAAGDAHPGDAIRLEGGERTPLDADVVEGFGTSVGVDGLPVPVAPGETVSAGARLFGGPFVLTLRGTEAYTPQVRPAPIAPSLYDRYTRLLGVVSLGDAALTAVVTRSLSRTMQALLLVNPRTALIGKEAADTGASARVLRSGVTVVGTRQGRIVRLPDALLLDSPRLLTDGYEIAAVVPMDDAYERSEILERAAGVAAAVGSPWGGAVRATHERAAVEGRFDGREASADIGGTRYRLGSITGRHGIPTATRMRYRGMHLMTLRSEGSHRPLGLIALRPRLAAGVADLVAACARHGVELGMLDGGDPAAAAEISQRAGIPPVTGTALEAIRVRQAAGALVAFAADRPQGAAFDACDLAIGMIAGRGSHFPARADFLAPDLAALQSIVDASAQRELAVRDSVLLSAVANLFGAVWGFRGAPGLVRASYGVYVTALAAMTDGWVRLHGGERSRLSIAHLVDPRPERWGRRDIPAVLRALKTSERGLTSEEARRRREAERPPSRRNGFLGPILDQLRSPLTGVLAAGAGLSFVLGATGDVVMIAATLLANVAVGAWQERQTGQAIAALERMSTSSARVLRDGESVEVPAAEIVPGDVLMLAPGDRIAADARVLSAHGLEIDEAALTGESLPTRKDATGGTDAARVLLAGSDVTVGTGLAAVTAVGRRTRMGATAAALALDETRASPLGVRLSRMLRLALPLAAGGGLVVFASGLLRRRPALPQLAIAASIAIAAVPEGLPLLAGVSEAAVARRLADRRALVRRLSAIEALGRVDVACTDKTGTLTEGRPALTDVATMTAEARPEEAVRGDLRHVLLAAGLATPHPDAADAAAHPTDVAVIRGVRVAGLGDELRAVRQAELSFDPARSFHAAVVNGRMVLKGAVEALAPRCSAVRVDGREQALDESGRDALAARAEELARRGLRVLMVAEGAGTGALDNPQTLVAVGFIGISDPLRREVPAAVRRCHEAGVRVVMLTGDHPATAEAIARQAGILGPGDELIMGSDIAELQNGELDERLNRVTVIARVTPLDKLRIVESLRRRGHTVAMTGDGVNDAPALRLADVGVAMGLNGTEVARQAADLVLADDNFSTLVEALVEGRSFWRNIRRAVALLLGGNLGELGLVVSASVLGLASPLLTRQILAVNVVTDVLPSLAVALQPPETRNLAGLAREGTAALDRPLARDVRRRGIATALPTLLAYGLALRSGGLAEARSAAFAGVVTTQLAQTLDAGRSEHALTRSVFGAVAGSAGVLVAALTLPPLQQFLSLAPLTPLNWALVLAAAPVAVLLGRGVRRPGLLPARLLLPAPARSV